MTLSYSVLNARALLEISGTDACSFLQGLVTSDVLKVSPERSLYTALLSPQGKFLYDFFLYQQDDRILLECAQTEIAELQQRLSIYKLRSKVTLAPVAGLSVIAAYGEGTLTALHLPSHTGATRRENEALLFVDPRYAPLGARVIGPENTVKWMESLGFTRVAADDYDAHRLSLGIPEGGTDLIKDKSFILENGFEELHGVDFAKGCYVGQEVTARTKYRGVVRKSLYGVSSEKPLPPPGTSILLGDKKAGEMRSSRNRIGLALLRHEEVAEAKRSGSRLTADGIPIDVALPAWNIPTAA